MKKIISILLILMLVFPLGGCEAVKKAQEPMTEEEYAAYLKNRYKILKDSHRSGIYNLAFTMLGFPTETEEEAKYTMHTLANNFDFLHPIPPSICVATKHSKLLKFMQKNNIILIEQFWRWKYVHTKSIE